MADENTELTLDDVLEVEPADLSDEQKTFLEENKDDLDDEQKERYGFSEESDEDDGDDDKDEDIEPVTRTTAKGKEDDGDDDRIIQIENRVEVDEFVRTNPEFSKYRDSILKHANHTSYRDIPVDRIAMMVAGKDLVKIGAKKEREAAQKANESKGGGSSTRPTNTGKVDWKSASSEDYEQKRAEVLGRPS